MNRVSIKKNLHAPTKMQNTWNQMKLLQSWIDMTDEDIARSLGKLKENRKWVRLKSMKKCAQFVDY